MGTKLTRKERWLLPKSDFACPEKRPAAGSYPINDPSRVVSAVTYYQRNKYQRCPGGQARICARAKKFSIISPKIKGFCEAELKE